MEFPKIACVSLGAVFVTKPVMRRGRGEEAGYGSGSGPGGSLSSGERLLHRVGIPRRGGPAIRRVSHRSRSGPWMSVGEMLIGEVKEGKAELNEAAREPAVLQAALTRFGCCQHCHVSEVVKDVLQKGHAVTDCGHRVRMVAFGASPGHLGRPRYDVVSLGHIEQFLRDYISEHWEVLHQAQFKDPVFGFLVMLEKGHRGWVPAHEGV